MSSWRDSKVSKRKASSLIRRLLGLLKRRHHPLAASFPPVLGRLQPQRARPTRLLLSNSWRRGARAKGGVKS